MTPLKTIQSSPSKANALFAEIADTSPGAVKTRERLFGELRTELELLLRLERDHLLPVLKRPGLKSQAPKLTERADELREVLGEIEAEPKEGDEFPGRVAALKRLFQQHLREKKAVLLPALEERLDEEELRELAQAIEDDLAAVQQAAEDEAERRRAAARRQRERAEAAEAEAEAEERQARRAAQDAQRRKRDREEALQAEAEAAEREERRLEREAQREARRVAKEAEQTVRATAEAAAGTVDGAQRTVETGLRAAAAVGEDTVRSFAGSGRTVAAVAEAGSVVAGTLQEVGRVWADWAQSRMQRQVQGLSELMQCRTPREVVGLQVRLVREGVEELLDTSGRVSEIAAGAAGQAARAVTPQG